MGEAVALETPAEEAPTSVYCCRRCRQVLFIHSQIKQHEPGQQEFSFRRQAKDRRDAGSFVVENTEGAADAPLSCTSYFLDEALQWMKDASEDVEGKLLCPKCATRVGALKWAGSQCSCGSWITPAIQLYKKTVDERSVPPTLLPQQ